MSLKYPRNTLNFPLKHIFNMKNMFNNHECRACLKESESDQHVLACKIILDMNKDFEASKIPKYEKLYNGNSNEQLEISRIFSANMKILESFKEEHYNAFTLWGPCDQNIFSASAVCTDTMYKLNELID